MKYFKREASSGAELHRSRLTQQSGELCIVRPLREQEGRDGGREGRRKSRLISRNFSWRKVRLETTRGVSQGEEFGKLGSNKEIK